MGKARTPNRGRFSTFLAFSLVSAIAIPALAQRHSEITPRVATASLNAGSSIAGRYIVVLKDTVADDPADVAADLAKAYGLTIGHIYAHALSGFAAAVPNGALAGLEKNPRVAYLEPDQIATVSALPTGIRRIEAETVQDKNNVTIIDGTDDRRVDVDVAVLDTGIDLDHSDLNVFQAVSFAGGNGDDGHGHGTHVAGTIGALDDAGNDVAGVAPGARLWAVKVLNNGGTGSYSNIIAGIDYVTAHAREIEVANMSLGGGHSNALCSAIGNSIAAGVTYAVAAGNEDTNAGTRSPADCADVITVSALADFDGQPGGLSSSTCRSDEDDTIANFSNWGSTVEIIAPGVCIRSTWKNGGYNTISGTSMAAPHVAGAAALVAASGEFSPETILNILTTTGTLDWNPVDDPDDTQEPLLNLNAPEFDPATVSGSSMVEDPPLANDPPVVTITAPVDGANPSSGSQIVFTATATDNEDGDISSNVSWSSNVAGSLGSGASITIGDDEPPLGDGEHIITASINDSGAADGTNVKSDNDSITITMGTPPPAPDFTVAGVSYTSSGGRLKDKHLTVAVDVDPDIVGIVVSIVLQNASGGLWNGTNTTDSTGSTGFTLSNAPSGCYTTTVTDVNGIDPGETPVNGFALRVDPGTCSF